MANSKSTLVNESKIELYAGKIEREILKAKGPCACVMIDELFESGKINQRESRALQAMFLTEE